MSNNANLFEFESGKTRISYSESSFMGVPLFTYQDGKTSISTPKFTTETCALGVLVTMTIEISPDAFTRDVSLIVPHVHLGKQGEAPVESVAVFSTHKTTIAGHDAVTGQVTTYETLSLKGRARRVVF